jgi:hypothetical protein
MFKDNLKIKSCKLGLGVFTDIKIPANVPIIEITGNTFNYDSLPNKNSIYNMQIGNDLYITQSGDIDDYLNHSCNPNCYMHIVGKRAILYSLYVIPAGKELTFDYSLISTDLLEEWGMICLCGDFNCRKTISGFGNLPQHIKDKYKKKGIIPGYIAHNFLK